MEILKTEGLICYIVGTCIILGASLFLKPNLEFLLKRYLYIFLLISCGIILIVRGGLFISPLFVGIGGFILSVFIWFVLSICNRFKGGNIIIFVGILFLIFILYLHWVIFYEAMILDIAGRYDLSEYLSSILPYNSTSTTTVQPYDVAIVFIMDWLTMTVYVFIPIFFKFKQFWKSNKKKEEKVHSSQLGTE